ncbi:MAG: putative bifunctional diguanylate cyclase/phosphodiesterase [Mariniblastus sp.]
MSRSCDEVAGCVSNGAPVSNGDDKAAVDAALMVQELAMLRDRNDALADAVVTSAGIIEELERTKLELADAQNATDHARKNAQRMAQTIFEETHDSMVVFDRKLGLISANRNARKMFGVEANAKGRKVMEQLTHQYRSEKHLDWISILLDNSDESRIELFKLEKVVDHSQSPEIAPEFIHKKHWIEVSISPLNNSHPEAEYLLTAHDITKRKLTEDQFQHQALHDNVTRLPNRRFFVKRIENLLSHSDHTSPFAVCFLDLDHFKTVNDTLGHEAGDQLLVQVAQRIKNTTRNDCFLARFGGDEFALLVPELSAQEVAAIGKRIVSELRRPFTINGNSVYIGASIGMTRYPDDAVDANGLMQNADVAMYSAKDGGRNCFHPFTRELADSIKERQSLLEDLRESIEKKDIALEYQPKWCLHTDQIAGCEALLRWERNGKPVAPEHLIEVAECSGLILPLGDLIVEKAIQQLAQWKREFDLNGKMAINLSPRQLVDRHFTQRFQEFADKAGVLVESIELEITETAMMENFEEAFERIKELKQIGADIAIDDFGTGYSSLSYLKSFPVSTLKIDRSFISDLPDDSKAVAVANAVLSLSHGLGLNVVAEGVENERQRDFLIAAGCDQVQGFLYSPAMKPEEFAVWAKNLNS